MDRLTMTDELEAIDDATITKRKIDHTLARFSAAHDELEAEEAKKRERRERLASRPAALLEQTRTALQRVVTTTDSEPAEAAEQSSPQTRLQEKKERKTRQSAKAGRITAAVAAALVFLSIGSAWGAQTWFDAKFNTVASLDEDSADIQDAAGQTGDENFLMVGSDSRDGASAEDGVGDAESNPGARSDTVMIAHVPADRQRVVMVSFPRDLEISRPECKRWDPATSSYTDKTSPAQKITKLNTAYAVGGPQCVTKVIQQITGMKMNHFVGIDFNGFKSMVDAVQGVTVYNEKPIDDDTLGMVIPQAGEVRISGDQALNYVRARHVKGDPTSDYGRIKRQQAFLGALLKTVMSKDVILDTGKLSGFIDAFAKATFGENLGIKQMMTLAKSMNGMGSDKVKFLTVPTTEEANKRGNEVLLQSKSKTLFQALINNTPLEEKAPAPPAGNTEGASSGSAKSGDPKKSGSSG
ncbi:LytR family transcriptional regulator [Amycolatopsis alba DSM 44262]|uniref:LytR family transcriptional regulator n=2 Tax=Amycolatopsis alba TaxID=76020 RepID=A0A229R2S7_AMYAL|nr:LCP family protein [Amycolatopsis alba]OXM40933.1 LytR family transcriptional regulator [Amycolatopsis alba DSM 44262]